MYGARPRPGPRSGPRLPPPMNRPVGFGQPIQQGGSDWRFKWPFVISMIIAVVLIILSLTIFGLEIGSLAKGTAKVGTYGNTASTGAGIWCGFFVFLAGVFILMIRYMPSVRQGATIALIATIIAICFSIVLIGLDAKAVRDGVKLANLNKDYYGSYYFAPKARILAAQLALACVSFLVCLAFVIMYIVVAIIPGKAKGRQQLPIRPPLR